VLREAPGSVVGTIRVECLDANWFTWLTAAQQIVETWRGEYNESRPHRALGEKAPNEFAMRSLLAPISLGFIEVHGTLHALEAFLPQFGYSIDKTIFGSLTENHGQVLAAVK
jgi:hypothetical protein